MADFQFYRPQANALEQLWSQYADSKGKTGGAFESAFAKTIAPGLERLGQNLEQRRERKFQEARQEDAQKFQTEERIAGQEFQTIERMSADRQRDLDREDTQQFQLDLFREGQQATENERRRLAADDLAAATAIFSANGDNPHDAYLRGQQAKTRQNALAITETENAVKQQKAKEAAAAAEAARLNSERSEAGGLFTALQGDKLTDSIAIQGAMDLVNSTDEKLILEGKDKLRTLAQESRQRGALMTNIDELLGVGDLTTAALQGKTLVQPGKEDEFTEARNVLIGAKQVLATPQLWQAKSPAERQVVVKSAEEASIKIRTLTSPNPYQDPRLRDEYSKQGLRNWLQLGDAKAPVVFYNGQVAGVTPEDKASLDLWISKQISNDPILRNMLRDQGFDQNLVQTALAAGNTAGITQLLGATTPSGSDVRTLIEQARTRITKDTLRSMGVRIVDPQIPEGVNVIQALQPTQQAEVARIVQAFANDVFRTQGRQPTNQEFADHMMSKGYYDLEFVAQGVVPKQAAQAAAPAVGNNVPANAGAALAPATGTASPAETKPARVTATSPAQDKETKERALAAKQQKELDKLKAQFAPESKRLVPESGPPTMEQRLAKMTEGTSAQSSQKTWDGYPPYVNRDGSISTERTITVTDPRINNGKPTNIPTLWEGKPLPGKTDAEIQKKAIEKAIEYQRRTGNKWKSFDSIESAVSFAEQKSSSGGSKAGSLFKGLPSKPYLNRNSPEEADLPIKRKDSPFRQVMDVADRKPAFPSVVAPQLPTSTPPGSYSYEAMIRLYEQNKKR